MAVRRKLTSSTAGREGLYFSKPSGDIQFIRSGSTTLDCAISGGYPLGRMINIIGDKSTGKTLLAIEATANFAKDYPDGLIWYRETEAAFDEGYAEAVGMPVSRVSFDVEKGENKKGKMIKGKLDTVEEFARDLQMCCRLAKKKRVPGIYILDSMDALSDQAEAARDFGEASYGTGKSRANSELFRKLTRLIQQANVSLIIISQVRAAIGVTFGDKTRRSGGAALDFYATLIIKLAHLGRIAITRKSIKRDVGVKIRAKVQKNKIGMPFREAEFSIAFGFGINDAASCLTWLKEVNQYKRLNLSKKECGDLQSFLDKLDQESYNEWKKPLRKMVKKVWEETEVDFLPAWKKYD